MTKDSSQLATNTANIKNLAETLAESKQIMKDGFSDIHARLDMIIIERATRAHEIDVKFEKTKYGIILAIITSSLSPFVASATGVTEKVAVLLSLLKQLLA